jgi:hypothetical protein
MRTVKFILILLLSAAGSVRAVIISGGDGIGNTNAPADDPGWANVGHIVVSDTNKLSSVTYLGDKWFITAYHVKHLDKPSAVMLDGAMYSIDSNSWTRITNGGGDVADLILFQTTTRPPVFPLRIRSSRIENSVSVVMAGDGRNRATNLTYWTSGWVVTNAASGVYSGYVWAARSAMRWGENTVSSRNSFDDGWYEGVWFGVQDGFQTTFNANGGSNECQGATYDSGGGVFYKNSGNWELAGIMLNTSGDFGRAVYGDETYMADISYYRVQITNTLVNFDSDIDGLPDWWESGYTNSTTAMAASVDSDGDGFSNLQEWIADTNPTDPESFFKNESVFTLTNQIFTFNGSTGRCYQAFYTTNDLAATDLIWSAAHTNLVWGSGTNSSITLTDTRNSAFYRLRVSLP